MISISDAEEFAVKKFFASLGGNVEIQMIALKGQYPHWDSPIGDGDAAMCPITLRLIYTSPLFFYLVLTISLRVVY